MSAAMTAAIAALSTVIDQLEAVAATEAPIVRDTVRDALCHVQLGADLLDRLQSR
jgi:hypothetical protein